MKRLIITLLSSIAFLVVVGQSNPTVVVGDMKIAANGTMKSVGAVNMKATDVQNSRMVNNGTLNVAGGGIIFYSAPGKDGLLLTNEGATVTAPTDSRNVKMHKVFEDNEFYYAISFPFDVNTNSITNAATGEVLSVNYDPSDGVSYKGLYIFEYDSQNRANTGLFGSNWKNFSGSVLKRGTGYRILSYDAPEVEFPAATYPSSNSDSLFAYSNKNLNGLIDYIKRDASGNPSQVGDYPEGRGWNYIGGLNTSAFDLRKALDFTIDGSNEWNQAIYYMKPNETYVQLLLRVNDAIASPYVPFFVQVRGGDNSGNATIAAHFYKDGVTISDAVPTDFRASEAANEDVICSLTLRSDLRDDDSDDIYLVFGDKYKDEYRIQEDAVKMFSNNEPQLWANVNSIQLFANALPRDGEGKVVNLGFSVPKAGQYTFEFANKLGDGQFVKKAILEDKTTGTQTDVLTKTYSFTANDASKASDRFVLYVNRSATGIDAVESPTVYAYVQDGRLTVKNVANGDKIQVVDLAGRVVASGIAQSSEFSTLLNQKGVFIVNVKGEKNAVLKVLSK
ncbi:MAG: DUF6383 domain-containing protein [Candidatus Azobacteroides sp.]|nr:DUF6383 domain-containing protein [Candidatus Azobacteroides sp.]